MPYLTLNQSDDINKGRGIILMLKKLKILVKIFVQRLFAKGLNEKLFQNHLYLKTFIFLDELIFR